jgi:hypothetical protein
MGSLQAQEIAVLAVQGEIGLYAALKWHLQSNHYPPVPDAGVDIAFEIVNGINEGSMLLDQPVESLGTNEGGHPTVREVVENWHLDHFFTWDEVYA